MVVTFIKHDDPSVKDTHFDVVNIRYNPDGRTITILTMFLEEITYDMKIWDMKALAK